jgi:hypothetical protein
VVSSVLGRQPPNLTTSTPYVYRLARYDSNDNLRRRACTGIGGPVDVAGGWFDAGRLREVRLTRQLRRRADAAGARDFPATYPALAPEACFGLSWLEKLWNPATKVLYIQVGIGTGNASNTIQGDYNFWFPPQAEDHMDVSRAGIPAPPPTT